MIVTEIRREGEMIPLIAAPDEEGEGEGVEGGESEGDEVEGSGDDGEVGGDDEGESEGDEERGEWELGHSATMTRSAQLMRLVEGDDGYRRCCNSSSHK